MGSLEGKNVSDYGSLIVCGWCGKILVYYSSATRAQCLPMAVGWGYNVIEEVYISKQEEKK